MVVCELDREVSGEVLGWKLPAWQSLLLHRVLPSCGGLLVYLTLICFDFTLIVRHYQDGENGLAAFCVFLVISPALISMVFTLASPPPGLQPELAAYTVKINKKDCKWIALQIINFLFFPVAAIGRYCHQIFWWVEAVYAVHSDEDSRAREAVLRARAPSPLELYLFLQSFLHAAPHAVINILDIMARANNPIYENLSLQAVSIVTSTLRMASTVTVYRRFEREKLSGRKYPWGTNSTFLDNENVENFKKNESEEEPIYEPIVLQRQSFANKIFQDSGKSKFNSNLMQFSPDVQEISKKSLFFEDPASESDASSGYISPTFVHDNYKQTYSDDSDEEYIRPISIIDRVAPRRRDREYVIEKVNVTPPPTMPAPRPGSIAVWAEKMVENAEHIPIWLSAPQRRRHGDEPGQEVVLDEPELPRRTPRSYMRGLEPQDVSAALVHFIGWYAFFIARLLSIAAFIDFFAFAAIIVLFSHYQVMLLFLIVPQASSLKRGFYLFLSFVYLFCLMEFKIRFRHVRVWHVFWIIICTIETIVFSSLWFLFTNNFGDWWKNFVVMTIFVNLLLSYMCFLVYFVLLKPRETIVQLKNTNI